MRKMTPRFTLLTLLVLVVSALSGCAPQGGATPTPKATPIPGSQEVTATLRTYYDPSGYFSIGYPPDWEVLAADRQVEFVEPYGNLHILVQYVDAGQALDEAMMRELIDSYFAAEEVLGVVGFMRENETVQAGGGIVVEYSFTTADVPGYGRTLFQQRGTYVYILSFWVGQRNLWAANAAFFDTVTRTLMMTPPSK